MADRKKAQADRDNSEMKCRSSRWLARQGRQRLAQTVGKHRSSKCGLAVREGKGWQGHRQAGTLGHAGAAGGLPDRKGTGWQGSREMLEQQMACQTEKSKAGRDKRETQEQQVACQTGKEQAGRDSSKTQEQQVDGLEDKKGTGRQGQ